MNIKPYKGRTIEKGARVKVAFNLHEKMFSIRDMSTNLVVGYADIVRLSGVTFTVKEKDRLKVIAEQKKNVHAFVEGILEGTDAGQEEKRARYNPYKYSSFVDEQEKPIHEAKSVTCIDRQIRYSN